MTTPDVDQFGGCHTLLLGLVVFDNEYKALCALGHINLCHLQSHWRGIQSVKSLPCTHRRSTCNLQSTISAHEQSVTSRGCMSQALQGLYTRHLLNYALGGCGGSYEAH